MTQSHGATANPSPRPPGRQRIDASRLWRPFLFARQVVVAQQVSRCSEQNRRKAVTQSHGTKASTGSRRPPGRQRIWRPFFSEESRSHAIHLQAVQAPGAHQSFARCCRCGPRGVRADPTGQRSQQPRCAGRRYSRQCHTRSVPDATIPGVRSHAAGRQCDGKRRLEYVGGYGYGRWDVHRGHHRRQLSSDGDDSSDRIRSSGDSCQHYYSLG